MTNTDYRKGRRRSLHQWACGGGSAAVMVIALAASARSDEADEMRKSLIPTTRPAIDSAASLISNRAEHPPVPEPKQQGGESEGIVQVANLVYAGTQSSKCFADHFLIEAEKGSSISTSRRFHSVKLASDEIYEFPLAIMTGEGTYQLSGRERENLRHYVERGGFLLASAGCSSREWDRSFRDEMAAIFRDIPLKAIDMTHPLFHTVFDIDELKAKHGKPQPLEGISLDGRLGVVYSQDGLNDTGHTQGCCCCGGNELTNAIRINVNILGYALVR